MRIENAYRAVARGPGRLLSRFLRGRKGIAQVELALLLPFFALLVIAIIDFGSVINHKMTLANALRAGTQYALIRKPRALGDGTYDTLNIRKAVKNTAPEGILLDPNGISSDDEITAVVFCVCADGVELNLCSDDCGDGSGTRSSYLRLNITDLFSTMIPYPGIPDTMQLEEEVVVRLN